MSALVILECNACTAISPPYPTAEKARGAEAPDGWTVAIDGEDLDYCPQCTAPAGDAAAAGTGEQLGATAVEPTPDSLLRGKFQYAVRAIGGLGDLLAIVATSGERVPFEVVQSTAKLGARYAEETLRELES